jgi:hypothetical protein
MSIENRSRRMWVQPDVLGLFLTSVGSFSANVGWSALLFSDNLGTKMRCYRAERVMLLGHYSYQSTPATLKKAIQDIKSHAYLNGVTPWDNLMTALSALDQYWNGKQLNSKSVGGRLRAHQGQILGNKRLVRMPGSTGGAAQWKVEIVSTPKWV